METRVRWIGALGATLALAIAIDTPAQAAPVQETQGQIGALHGGIGEEDRAAMAQKAADHNVHLALVRKGSGAYLADVRVVIRNSAGAAMLDTVVSGPWLFVRLPAGQYTIAATEQGNTLTQAIAIKGAERRDAVFRFELPAGAAPELNPL